MMSNPRLLRFLATGLSFIAGYISVALGHGDTTMIVAGGGLLLIAIALSFRAHRLADRKPDDR